MSDEKKGGKVGFLSSSYRPANGLTASESRVLSETIATEGGWYCKEVPGHRPSDAAFDAKNTYLSHISKKAVNTPTDVRISFIIYQHYAAVEIESVNFCIVLIDLQLPADLDLFTRVTASRATGDYKYCSKCKRDCYFCRHREEFASPDPKETYIVPAATYVNFFLFCFVLISF
jgi:hypothetical protein